MKRINKKICSTVCALLAFSGNRGGALTKEILCNAGQWLACFGGYAEYYNVFNYKNKQGEWVQVPRKHLTRGQKAFGYATGAATVLNAVDASKRSYDIAHDVIKGSNNKPDTTNKKESKNYWPILEAIFGVSQFAHAFGHRPIMDTVCKGICSSGITGSITGLASLADAYFRFRGSNQSNESQISEKKETAQQNLTSSNPKNSKNSESDKK